MTRVFKLGVPRPHRAADGLSLYETPEVATRTLLRVERLPGRVWEPAVGRGAISSVLKGAGIDVVETDLVDHGVGRHGVDFLMEQAAPAGVEAIVTNPPFTLADQFVRHALRLAPAAYMLLRWQYAEGERKSDIIDRHLSRVWLGRERLPMMHREGHAGPKLSKGGAPFAWFVFERRPMVPGAFLVRRVSWYGDVAGAGF